MGKNEQVENLTSEEEVVEETLVAESEEGTPEQTPLEQLQAQVDEYRESLQRERADFQNYRKRIEREKESLQTEISAKVLAKFLPILDDFERALGAVPPEQQDSDWLKGVTLIQRKFQSLLESEGIQPIDPLGQEFDPKFHEAIGADEASETHASGQVTAVLQKGYVRGDRVLRPAMVRVAS